MVTIFDMVTGELLHSDARPETARSEQATRDHALLAPRLQTVVEASACEAPLQGMPADLARMDIGLFLGRQ